MYSEDSLRPLACLPTYYYTEDAWVVMLYREIVLCSECSEPAILVWIVGL